MLNWKRWVKGIALANKEQLSYSLFSDALFPSPISHFDLLTFCSSRDKFDQWPLSHWVAPQSYYEPTPLSRKDEREEPGREIMQWREWHQGHMKLKPSQNALIKLQLLPQHRTATATIYLMLFFSKASKNFELLMEGANKVNLCQTKGSYLFGKQHSPFVRAAQSDAFTTSTMADTQELWQNIEKGGKTHLRPNFLSIFERGLAWV